MEKLFETNPYLKDPIIRREMTVESVYSSSKLEGSSITKEKCYELYDKIFQYTQ